MSVAPTLLEVRNLKKHFPIKKGLFNRQVGSVKAVDGISFEVNANETVGLVGESGCGKTTAGRSLLRLLEPTDGEVLYKGQDILKMGPAEMRSLRRNLQIIFQDPFSSLNPRMTIESIIGEAITFHKVAQGPEVREMVEGLLERVGLQPSYITRYPHEFSGGQRQRVGIARALALNPDFIVCDEAVSALDVSVQAQVINLLMDLQQEYNLSYLFIAHDLSVVQHISDRIAVMYLGQIAEFAECDELYENPLHPYTQALLSAIPQPNPRRRAQRIILKGDVPSPMNPPSGCRFHTRCPACFAPCKTVEPRTVEPTPGHKVRCHLYDPEFAPNDPDIWARLPRQPDAPKSEPVDVAAPANEASSTTDAPAPDGTDGVASTEASETTEVAENAEAGAESSDVSTAEAPAESAEPEAGEQSKV
ncbi:dipeptide ABC transporter ATP-binding protein [Lujinxingia vulgaris]|uniref:Dipeptide ABC transporter ATP-binding protein n=1 Tax=Lujinxingia vulgaris TaxID=2600176 RepID=A0A5C6XP50_9DELT|nr:ABC transporter ATP-binding protein [Lujinxingia vulgaris]TXD39382.1 dipeptide ABC transporter ATP-binding protein [Lujinxingia vulgaris]